MDREQLVKDLLDRKLIRIGESLSYQGFQEVRQKSGYSYIGEYEFAELLGVSNTNFSNVKNKGQNTIILRELIPSYEEELSKTIAEFLLNSGKVEAGQRINYQTFCQFHEEYPYVAEPKFAKFLEISQDSLSCLRRGIRDAQIYKSRFSEESVIEDLIERGIFNPGAQIEYVEFLELFQKASCMHPSIAHYSQYAFAKMLGIRKSTFTKFKNGETKRLQILKRYMKKYSFKLEVIADEILKSGKLRVGDEVTATRFDELYREYGYLGVLDFADVLEISHGTLERIRRKEGTGATTVVFKSRIPEKIQKPANEKANNMEFARRCVEKLFQEGVVKVGQKINYETFQEIYSLCNVVSERELAFLLGISSFKYQNMRYMSENTYIQDRKIVDAFNIIGDLEKQRFYTSDEIDAICNKYGVTREDFIVQIIFGGTYEGEVLPYLESMDRHNGIYIGKTIMSNQYFESIYERIRQPIRRLVGSMLKHYGALRLLDDYSADSIVYVFENCGDIERNFSDSIQDSEIINRIIGRVKLFLLDKVMKELKLNRKVSSSATFYKHREKSELQIADDRQDTEKKVLKKELDDTIEAKIMSELIIQFENGMEKQELLDMVGRKFDVTPRQLLNLLEKRVQVKKHREGMKLIGK